MRQFGLLGYPLTHSFSVAYFKRKFEQEKIKDAFYEAFPLENLDGIREFLKTKPHLIGLNVTIPFKEAIIPYLDFIDPVAQKVGAINTIKISKGVLSGYNTDIVGFKNTLEPMLQNIHLDKVYPNQALILGTGGAAKAVAFVLQELSIPFTYLSRWKSETSITYSELNEELMVKNQLIINCTPLGMSPNFHNSPNIPYDLLNSNHILYDLIYNPEETRFLKEGRKRGTRVKNGLDMLINQAEASWQIWNQ